MNVWGRLHRTAKIALVLAALATGAVLATLVAGWGLGRSERAGAYRLVGAWPFASGQPFGIAVDPRNGNVLVTDAASARVVRFDADGGMLGQFGAEGDGAGQFMRPSGIAVAEDGSVYVADYDLDRIQKFTEQGEHILHWATSGGEGELRNPSGLAVDRAGRVYVADFLGSVVKVFDAEGRFAEALGTPGQWRSGSLDYPTEVNVAPDGRVFIADAYNYRIQMFDAGRRSWRAMGWEALRLVPRPGSGAGGFDIPTGVAFDPQRGVIHVADSANRRIVMLDSAGRFMAEWGIRERGPGFHTPQMVAVSPDGGRLYATDLDNSRVLVLAVEADEPGESER